MLTPTQVFILLVLVVGVPFFWVAWKLRAPKGTKLTAVYDKETNVMVGMKPKPGEPVLKVDSENPAAVEFERRFRKAQEPHGWPEEPR